MTKQLHNAIMKRSRYRNKFLKDKSQTNREDYKIQRNFCKESNIDSYADDNTPYSCPSETQTVISELKLIFNKLFHWFQYNHLKANPGKFNILLSSKTLSDVSIGDASLTTSIKETLLGILLTQNSFLTNMFLPFAVKLARNYMFQDALPALCLSKNVEH